MALRRVLGCLPAAVLVLSMTTGCKGKGGSSQNMAELEKRCESLAKACGDTDKHIEKFTGECKELAKTQGDKPGCADKVLTLYHCYENAVCGTGDKVWAVTDLRVLADRHKKCEAERDAAKDCFAK